MKVWALAFHAVILLLHLRQSIFREVFVARFPSRKRIVLGCPEDARVRDSAR